MQYRFSEDDLFARIGRESLKLQAAEGQVAVLEVAVQIALGVLKLDAEGISMEMFAAASAEIERLMPTSEPEPEPTPQEP